MNSLVILLLLHDGAIVWVKLVREAQKQGIRLRQTYRFVGKKAFIMQGRYASARQMKRAAKQTRKLKTYLGRVRRDIERKSPSNKKSNAKLIGHGKASAQATTP